MQGCYLKFYVQESRRHHGVLAYEWLLEAARRFGIPGGSAFRAIAGYGRHGKLREEHFFELAGDLPVEVGFAVEESQAQAFLDHLVEERLEIFHLRIPIEMGIVGATPPAPPIA